MKKILSAMTALVICFLLIPFSLAQSGEWTCQECGKVNTGLFCGACGHPKETPSPTPSPTPKPSPTPAPETWQCLYCEGINPWENSYCNYCGIKKSGPKGIRFENPVAPLYYGMTPADVKEACGGERISKFSYHGYTAYVDYLYDKDRLYRIHINISPSQITFSRFLNLVQSDFGFDGWDPVMYLDGYSSPYTGKSMDEVHMVLVGTDSEIILAIDLKLNWDNIKAGRELVKQEALNNGRAED